jgi:hypothetical protein
VRSEWRTRFKVRAYVTSISRTEKPIHTPASRAATRIPVPVADSQLSVKMASSARALATTGGTRSTSLSR